jgi:hypothetical protein
VDVETDTTLSVSGKPADSKKVGDELSDIKADLGESISGYSIGYSDKTQWYNGAISSSGEYSSNAAFMSISNEPLLADTDIYIKVIPNGLKWGMRFFNKNGSVYTQTTSIYNAQDERIVKVNKGLYYCFNVNRGGGAMTPTLNVCNLYFNNFVHDVATKVEYNIIIDYGKFPHTWFDRGTLSQGNVNNSTYRVCTPHIIRLDFDVILTAKDGWRYAIHYFNDGDQFSSDSGWNTNGLVKIASGQGFKLLIRRETEDTSENADIQTFVNSIKVIGGVLTEFDMPIEYTYSVSGQKIDIQKTKYNVIATQLLPSPIAQVGATAYQGTGYSNGTIFQFYKDDYVELIDYTTGESIAILSSPTKHGNSVAFTDEYYDTNDEFPIAIVSDSTSEALAYRVRIQRTAATLLDAFKFPVAQAGYYGNVVLDVLNEVAYVVGYTNNTFSDGTGNKTIVSKWNLHELTDNGDETKTPEYVDSFTLPFIQTAQGMQFWNGKIFVISSKVSSTAADTKVYVIDPFDKRIASVMESFPTEIKTHETEGICFIDDQETVKAIIFTGGYKYREIVFS